MPISKARSTFFLESEAISIMFSGMYFPAMNTVSVSL